MGQEQSGVRKNLFWMGGTAFAGQIITWSITIWVARLLLPSDYGLVALAGVFTVFAQMVCEMGVGTAVIQVDEISKDQYETLYAYSLLLGVAMFIIGFLIGAPLMAYFYDEPKLQWLIRYSSLVFIISAARSMPRNILARNVRFEVIAKVEASSRILTSFCVLAMALQGFGVWALASQWLLIELFQFLGFIVNQPVRPSISKKFGETKYILYFGIKIVLRNIVYQFYNLCDGAIIGKIGSQSFLGAYSFAKQLTNMPFEKIIRIVNQVLLPYLSKDKKDLARLRQWTVDTVEMQMVVIVPFYLFVFFCAEEIVMILLGSNWEEAIIPLQFLSIAHIFKLAESYNSNLLTALGRITIQIKYMATQFLIISSGIILLSILFNIETSLYVWVLFYPIITIAFTRISLQSIDLRIIKILKKTHRIVIVQGLLVAFLLLVSCLSNDMLSVWHSLIIKGTSGIIFYVSVFYLLDKKNLRRIFSSFRGKI